MVTGIDLVEWMVRLARGDLPPLADARRVRESDRRGDRGARLRRGSRARLPAERGNRHRMACARRRARRHVDRARHRGDVVLRPAPREDRRARHRPRRRDRPAARRARRDPRSAASRRTSRSCARAAADAALSRGCGRDRAARRRRARRPTRSRCSSPGAQTTVQDYPGRLGYWDVGVPPSGPMDDLAFRFANRLVGNRVDAAALECTMTGPDVALRATTRSSRSPARGWMPTSTASPVPWWTAFAVGAGQVLRLGAVTGRGRADVPRSARRARRSRLSRLPLDVHPRSLRRSRRPRAHGRATCCTSARDATRRRRHASGDAVATARDPDVHARRGTCASSPARTPRPTSSPPPTSRCCTRRSGRCTTIPIARACA